MWPFVSGFFHLACFDIHPHCSRYQSFLWLNNIPFYIYTTICLSIFNWWTFGLFCLLDANEHVSMYICLSTFICSKVELLGYMVILCWAFWGTSNLFFHNSWTVLHSHQQYTRISFSHLLIHTCYFLLLMLSHPRVCSGISLWVWLAFP